MRARYLSAICCCAAALAIGGCGSSGSGSNSVPGHGPAPLAVFRTDLNQLCKEANVALARVSSNLAKVIALDEQYLPKFQALNPPPDEQPLYARFLANAEAALADFKAGKLRQAEAVASRNRALAIQLHAPACAR
ncbi:MAG: hypothetical protein ACJ764_07260 [Solirubrobacteraceae bacterium]